MTQWPVYARISGPIVMVGFGSIGKGTLPLIERHLDYDKSRITVLDPKDEGRKALCEKHGVRFIQQGADQGELSRVADAAADRRRRPGLLRQPVGRYGLRRHHGALQRARRALHRHGQRALARLLLRLFEGSGRALQLRAARDDARRQEGAPPRLDDGRLLLRRQPRHGLLLREAGGARYRVGPEAQCPRAEDQGRMGGPDAADRRQGHPHRRAGHAALQIAEAAGGVRQHLVGRGLPVGGHAAGRARLGHP